MSIRRQDPILLSIDRFHPGRTISALLVPQSFSRKPEFTLNMEQVLIGSWDRGNQGLCAGPYCAANSMALDQTKDGLKVLLRGELDARTLEPGLSLPYALELELEAGPHRVRVRGEMRELDYPLIAFTPCLYSLEFSRENHPPFEMARKSFMYFEGQGFTWLSDAERTRSEWHRDPPVDHGGPWIQLFATRAFADVPAVIGRTTRKEIASSPVVGWVANDDAYLVAIAGKNAYQGGIRWGPCLHSDVACLPGSPDRSFEMVIYALPVNLELLQEMVGEDFPDLAASAMSMRPDTLWPRTAGHLLNSFEGDDLSLWHAAEGTLSPYRSEWVWINGNLERTTYAEGFTEGKGSALWEIPAGEGRAALSGSVHLPLLRKNQQITHVALDALNRGPGEVRTTTVVESGGQRLACQEYLLHPWANRRLLLPLVADPHQVLQIAVIAEKTGEPARLVLDNLRGFHHDQGPS